ncbi:MAG: hypothetical protein H9Q65_03705 [Spiroplasma ixodetis]|nr:hypothetical protein [Spiroplasma ixodetis]MBP1528341.1 hypothetical protein [Spiroplasma ixodetis]
MLLWNKVTVARTKAEVCIKVVEVSKTLVLLKMEEPIEVVTTLFKTFK